MTKVTLAVSPSTSMLMSHFVLAIEEFAGEVAVELLQSTCPSNWHVGVQTVEVVLDVGRNHTARCRQPACRTRDEVLDLLCVESHVVSSLR
jgi:hypothetical protein